jgi:nucleotide-binding universal stress UspA family protein
MSHTLLVAVDGSDNSMRAAGLAGELAGKLDAPLTILHVLMHGRPVDELARMAEVEHLLSGLVTRAAPTEGSLPRTAQELRQLNEAQVMHLNMITRIGDMVLERAVARAEDAGARDISTRTNTGDCADAILESAGAVGADMIVVGSRGLGQVRGLLLGSVSHKVAQHAACTVVTVK